MSLSAILICTLHNTQTVVFLSIDSLEFPLACSMYFKFGSANRTQNLICACENIYTIFEIFYAMHHAYHKFC